MLSLNKKVFLICIKKTHLLKFGLTNHNCLSSCLRCITSNVWCYSKNRSPLSVLFTPMPVKTDIEESKAGEELTGKLNKSELIKVINSFYRQPQLKNLAQENGLDSYLLQKGFVSFRKYCLHSENLPPDLHITLSDIIQKAGNSLDIFPYFLRHLKEIFPHLECMDDLKKIGDLRTPAKWYPEARNIRRKIIFHCGPTNSGKTYHAIKRFFEAESGVYCGPLKLLAVEIFNKANENGVQCDLVTGEEVIYTRSDGDHTNHVSCTIEMCSLEKNYDVAVIDEIQMIRDLQRGWAWTRALLGLKAKEIHICGEESTLDLIDSILCTTDENFEVKKYKRLTELEIDSPVENFENIQPGDCIVCFKKRDIFEVTKKLESLGKEVAVIYGTLPPGTKLAQCKKFNDPNDSCKILVATDAIGMGLNLSIRRVVFYSVVKPVMNEQNGSIELSSIPVSQALQIAGRAGRYNSHYSKGFVTTFKSKDLSTIKNLLSRTPEPAMSAGLLPTVDQIELYAFYLPHSTLSNLMEIFLNLSTVDDSMYFMCDIRDFKYLAEMIEHIPLPLRIKYVFCSAPINKKFQFPCLIFLKFAKMYSENKIITFNWLCKNINWPVSVPKSIKDLVRLETIHDSLDLYLWLSYRFPDYFPDNEAVKEIQGELDMIIHKGIVSIGKLFRNLDDLMAEYSEKSNEKSTSKHTISKGNDFSDATPLEWCTPNENLKNYEE